MSAFVLVHVHIGHHKVERKYNSSFFLALHYIHIYIYLIEMINQSIIEKVTKKGHPGFNELLWTDVRSCSGISIQFTTGKSWPFSTVSLRIYIWSRRHMVWRLQHSININIQLFRLFLKFLYFHPPHRITERLIKFQNVSNIPKKCIPSTKDI